MRRQVSGTRTFPRAFTYTRYTGHLCAVETSGSRIPARVPTRAEFPANGRGRKTEGLPGNNVGRRDRDKWQIDATVIYVDPLHRPIRETGCGGRGGEG